MHAGTRSRAAIAISGKTTVPFIQDLDLLEVIDDGNLATGNFCIGADDEPVFIVSPRVRTVTRVRRRTVRTAFTQFDRPGSRRPAGSEAIG